MKVRFVLAQSRLTINFTPIRIKEDGVLKKSVLGQSGIFSLMLYYYILSQH